MKSYYIDIDVEKEIFIWSVQDWDVFPIENKGKVVGAVIVRDNEIHIAATGPFYLRKYTRSVLNPIVEKYGYAWTRTFRINTKGIEFIRKLGFEPYYKTDLLLYLRIDHGICR